jgi:translation initiation factor IF-2
LSTSAKTKTDTVEVRIPGIGKVRIDLEDDDPGEAEYQRRLENVKREKSKFHSKIAPRIASPYDQSMNDLSYSDIESAFEEKNAQLENVKSQPVENLLKVDDSTTDNDYLNSDIHSTSQIEIEESKNETRFDELDRDTLNISTLSEKATKDESEDLLSQTKTIASNIPTTTISDTDIDLEEMEDLLEKSADKSLSLEPLEASLDSLASLDDFDEDILPNDASFGLDDKDILLDDKDILLDDKDILPDEDVPPDLEDLAPKGVDQVLPTVPKGIYTVAELRILLEDSLKHQAKMLEQNKELFAAPSNTYIDAKGRRRRRKPVKPVSEKALEKMKKEKLKHTVIKEVAIPSVGLELRELASSLSMKSSELYKRLEDLGEIMPSEDGENGDPFGHIVDADTAELVVIDLGLIAKRQQAVQEISVGTYSRRTNNEQNISNVSMDLRPPVVCIMGHVDHGKTTLLDYLRSTNVAAKEAGGITQRLSAFSVDLKKGGRVVFLDTPGHAAFSAMRANGASATDLVVLVVAIDDGVRPQTIEAIQAAKSAGCPIVIALNKIDKLPPSERPASRNKVLAQLADVGVLAEEFGGDSLVVEVSGRTGEGVMDLIENLSIQAEIMDLRAPTEGLAEATVLDAGMEKGRGIVANILTRWGKLSVGDPIVVGTCYGKVKNLYLNDRESVRSVGPATPVLLTGLQSIPQAGQELISVPSESRARAISERRQRIIKIRDSELASVSISSDTVSPPTDDGLVPPIILSSLSILLKADSPGTLNALEKVVKGIISRCKEISIQIVSSGVGDITQSDIERLIVVKGANTCILGFNVNFVNSSVRSFAKESDVKIIRDAVCL